MREVAILFSIRAGKTSELVGLHSQLCMIEADSCVLTAVYFVFLGHFPYFLPHHLHCLSNLLFPCPNNFVYHCTFTSRSSAKSRCHVELDITSSSL